MFTHQKNTAAFRLTPENVDLINAYISANGAPANKTDLLNGLIHKALTAQQADANPTQTQAQNTENAPENTANLQAQIERLTAENQGFRDEIHHHVETMDKMQAYVFSALNLTDELAAQYEDWKTNQLLPRLRQLTNFPELELTGQEIFALLLDYAQTDPVAEFLNIGPLTEQQIEQIEALRFPTAKAFEPIFLTKTQLYELNSEEAGSAESQEGSTSNLPTGQESASQESSQQGSQEESSGKEEEVNNTPTSHAEAP